MNITSLIELIEEIPNDMFINRLIEEILVLLLRKCSIRFAERKKSFLYCDNHH